MRDILNDIKKSPQINISRENKANMPVLGKLEKNTLDTQTAALPLVPTCQPHRAVVAVAARAVTLTNTLLAAPPHRFLARATVLCQAFTCILRFNL